MNIVETNLKFKNGLTKREKTDYLVVHHVGTMPKGKVDAIVIDGWHKNQGWSGIGYNFVILEDGTIQRGRPEWAVGAHVINYNSRSIGINVVGDFEKTEPTAAQKKSLIELLKYLKEKYPQAQIKGHCDLGGSACPGKNLYKRLGQIKFYVNQK
ncbi:MAG: N-acetylmuramoyl-L-alanine amidase [Anaerovoracaceae bacterium]